MGLKIILDGAEPGREFYALLQKFVGGVLTDYWDDAGAAWVAGPLPLAADAERVSLTAGSGVKASEYTGETSSDLDGYTGEVVVSFVDTSLSNPIAMYPTPVTIVDGIEFAGSEQLPPGPAEIGLEPNKAATVVIDVRSTLTGQLATGAVLSTQIATSAAVPNYSDATNAALYSGSPGIYLLSLTAAETNTADPLLVKVSTDDSGSGVLLVLVGSRTIEDDWANGGTLETLLSDSAGQVLTLFSVSVPALSASVSALPDAEANADAVWDEAISGHVAAGTAGNLVERLDVIATGGAGQLTGARAANLDNLDAPVSDETISSVGCSLALQAIHLDHLLAQDYNPASKPGVATALLNELIESDSGVSRFTANSLEQAPAGGGGSAPTAAAIRAEMDANSTQLAAIVADTNELQGDWADGGRLDLILDARATQSSVTALNNLSTGDVDARLAAIGLDHLVSASVGPTDVADGSIIAKITATAGDWSDFDPLTESLQAMRDRGDAAWVTGAGGSAPTVAQIRAEMDTNSTQLAAIVADTNELQADWADGGRLDLILDEIKTDGDAVLVDTDAIDLTLKTGGTIHTMIAAISATPNVISPDRVDGSRTWRARDEQPDAANVIVCNETDQLTLAMDFTKILNPDTGLAIQNGVTVVEGDAGDLTLGTPLISQDHRHLHVTIQGQLSGKRYKLRLQATTTDGEVISRNGVIKVS